MGTRRRERRRPFSSTPAVDFGADRIVKGDHLAHIRHYAGEAGRVEQQAIQHGFRQAGVAACRDILLVGSQDLRTVRLQFIGDGGQRAVFLCRADGRQLIGGLAGRLPHFLQTHNVILFLFHRCCLEQHHVVPVDGP